MIIGGKYAGSLDKILENVETVSKYVGGRPLSIFMMKPGLEDMVKLTERLHENAIPLVSELSNNLNKLFKHCRIISMYKVKLTCFNLFNYLRTSYLNLFL